MPSHCIPQAALPKTSALYHDYVERFDRVARFYGAGSPFNFASFRAVAGELDYADNLRAAVVSTLTRQNQFYGASETTLENLRRLARPGTTAVVTGQQVGLFSGPAFTLYKALSAVRLAQRLDDEGLAAVPVFWLATEDHDLEEVSSTTVLDDDYRAITLADPGVRPAPQSSVGYVRLSGAITEAIDKLADSLPQGESRDRLLADLRASYAPGMSWAEAFARFLSRLFGRWGVILLDALDPDLHRLAAPIYTQAITQAPKFNQALRERSKALVDAGYHSQVHVGEDSSLLFSFSHGNRVAVRLVPDRSDFILHEDGRFTADDLRSRAEQHPIDLSPNAVFRPIVQDCLLPTVGYVAGPAELAYHAQSAVLYPAFGRPQPVIVPRASFTLLDPRSERILGQYGLQVEDVWRDEEHLRRRMAAVGFAEGWESRLDESEREISGRLEALDHDISAIDPTLRDASQRARRRVAHQFDRLKGKITRAAFARSEILRRHEEALRAFLLPHGELQERRLGGVYFLGRAGYDLLDRLLPQVSSDSACHHCVPFQYALA